MFVGVRVKDYEICMDGKPCLNRKLQTQFSYGEIWSILEKSGQTR